MSTENVLAYLWEQRNLHYSDSLFPYYQQGFLVALQAWGRQDLVKALGWLKNQGSFSWLGEGL